MTADPPGRAPNLAFWAVRRGDRWQLMGARHRDHAYREWIVGWVPTADAALAWLTDHRRRNPR